MRILGYDINALQTQGISNATGAQNNFTQGVNPAALSAGEFQSRFSVVDGFIQSGNFVTGQSGWRIDSEGNIEANDGTFRGTIVATAGTIGAWTISDSTVSTSALGVIKAGQTDFDTGTGFFFGYSGGVPKFSIGDGTNKVTWDNETLRIIGNIQALTPVKTASYTFANLPAASTSVGFNSPSAIE